MSIRDKYRKYTPTIVVVMVIMTPIIAYDLILGGNMQFYSKWIQCGQRPQETDVTLGQGLPTYSEGRLFAMWREHEFYCTPLEAERDGKSTSSGQWSQPHLDAELGR